jgi:hypothetical protein
MDVWISKQMRNPVDSSEKKKDDLNKNKKKEKKP